MRFTIAPPAGDAELEGRGEKKKEGTKERARKRKKKMREV